MKRFRIDQERFSMSKMLFSKEFSKKNWLFWQSIGRKSVRMASGTRILSYDKYRFFNSKR